MAGSVLIVASYCRRKDRQTAKKKACCLVIKKSGTSKKVWIQ
jgi:hypothetical protein